MTMDEDGERELPDGFKGVLGKKQVENGYVKVVADDGDKLGEVNKLQFSGIRQGRQQQQSNGSVVCWERFLDVRSIRVLLVENDDSTRHVVTALLRNCNYEVVVAANELQAWRILEDLQNHIDIILTEVVMPGLSGFALLSRIMSHKTRKLVPVIMMSSHDSVGVVFKCLSKGAVDFLVKPIRKNELKNLWQHVWRRCHSSSGSGSESATQTQKSVKSKISEKADNSGGDGGENNGSNGLNVDDTSDDGSGTQSSWTKQAVEDDSSQDLSPIDQGTESPDSTCAQVIRPNPENSWENRMDISVVREVHELNQTDLERTLPKKMGSNSEILAEIPATLTGSKLKFVSELDFDMNIKHVENGLLNPSGEWRLNKQKGGIAKMDRPIEGRESGSTREGTSMLDIKSNAGDDFKESNLALTLKRLRGTQNNGGFSQDDRCVVRRSEQSAFTRYNTSSNTKSGNGADGAKIGSLIDPRAVAKLSSKEVNNAIDMGSTTDKHPKLPSTAKDTSEATSMVNGLHPSAFTPVKDDPRYVKPQAGLIMSNEKQTTDLTPARGSHQELQSQHSNCFHHHFHNLDHHPSHDEIEVSLKKIASDPPQCGLLNLSVAPVDGNPGNHSLNRSASGSNHLSNGQNGSSTLVNTVGTNTETDCGQAGKSGSGGDASGSGSGTGVDDKKLTLREAALHKFRQKRKERCFKKKVRYQNRKKLADSRPRVRGQFVKQMGPDSSSRSADE